MNDYIVSMQKVNRVIEKVRTTREDYLKQQGTADSKQTFAGMWKDIGARRLFIQNEYNDARAELDRNVKYFAPEVVNEKRAAFNSEWRELGAAMGNSLKSEVKSLEQKKRKAFDDMLTTPPTDAQQRLLNSLSARAGHIEQLELVSIMPSMFGNYQAMKQLQIIGAQNGTSISLPAQLDCTTVLENIDKATEFLLGVCEHIADSKNKLPLQYHAFFSVDPARPDFIQDPHFRSYCEVLDSVPQLNQCEVNKNGLTDSEKVLVKYLFHDVANLDASNDADEMKIMQHTKKVMQQHPDAINMLKLSDYKDYVKAVEAANAEGAEDSTTE